MWVSWWSSSRPDYPHGHRYSSTRLRFVYFILASIFHHVASHEQLHWQNAKHEQHCVHGRSVPSLYILGAQKSGTTGLTRAILGGIPGTSLANLSQHVALTRDSLDPFYYEKEVHFLDETERYKKGIENYASYYPSCDKSKIAMDATPNYFSYEGQRSGDEYWHRLYKLYNNSLTGNWEQKLLLVVVLRNPAERFLSAFHQLKIRDLNLTAKSEFPELLELINRTTARCFKKKLLDSSCGTSEDDMLKKGFYAPLFEAWTSTFTKARFIVATASAAKLRHQAIVSKVAAHFETSLRHEEPGKKYERNKSQDYLQLSEEGYRIEREALFKLEKYYHSLNSEFWSLLTKKVRNDADRFQFVGQSWSF